MPPLNDSLRYPDEAASAISAETLQTQFLAYFAECRRLQQEFAGQIKLFTAFETETYPGSSEFVKNLIRQTQPDYIVGSVHHVAGLGIDVNAELYEQAVQATGDIEQLYCAYFDQQFMMLEDLQPAVVGHFDLIRIFDKDYLKTLQLASVQKKIQRNLQCIADLKLIMDFNLRGFDKSTEQYPCMPVLQQALKTGVSVVPGDDSHGVSSVGRNYEKGVALLIELGHDCQWQQPGLYHY